MSDFLICLSLPDRILGWGGLRAEPGLVYRRAVVGGSHIWKPPCKLWLPCACSPSVIHHVACVKPETSQAKKKTACPFFCSFCFLHFAHFEELLDQFLLSAKLGQFLWLPCADMGYKMLSLSAQPLSPQVMFAHWNLKYELSVFYSVSPSLPFVTNLLAGVTVTKLLYLHGVQQRGSRQECASPLPLCSYIQTAPYAPDLSKVFGCLEMQTALQECPDPSSTSFLLLFN